MSLNDTPSLLSHTPNVLVNEARQVLEAALKRHRLENKLLSAGLNLKKHQKIVGSKIIILFGVALITVFALLFHKEERFKTMFELVQPDRISLLYLELLISMNPGDDSLRLALAHQHAKLGDVKDARLTLEPLLNQRGAQATEAKLLSLELDLGAYFAKSTSDLSKVSDLANLRKKIGVIADDEVPVAMLPEVIQRSLELERPELAAKLYEHWARVDSDHYFDQIQDAGHWYVAAGMPMQATDLYKAASASTSNSALVRKFALLAIKALQAADKTPLALEYATEYLKRYPKDVTLLDEAVKLSLASNDQKQALTWGNLRLGLSPENPEQIIKQIDLALAAGDIEVAWSLCEKLLMLQPNDIDIRKRSAQIAEWSGKQALALNQWAWLVRQNNADQTALENALRLSDGLKSDDTTISLLTAISEKRTFTGAELDYLVNTSSHDGHSDKAVALLHAYLIRYPSEHRAWEALAKVQGNVGQLKQALATWNHVGTYFGHSMIVVTHQADLLRRTGQPEFAFSKLLLNQNQASANDTEFWQLYGDLSLERKRTDKALLAYRTLWESNGADVLTAERLIQLLRDTAQDNDAVATAYKAYQLFRQPRWLLLAMDAAIQFKLWKELRSLMQIADMDKKKFKRLEMYWLIRAQFDIHNQQPRQALADYRQAHIVNPASTIAKEGELWTLIDLQNEVVARIDKNSRQFLAGLSTDCVYKTGSMGNICDRTR
jgi:polysaccharide biosynthesis protein PelB